MVITIYVMDTLARSWQMKKFHKIFFFYLETNFSLVALFN